MEQEVEINKSNDKKPPLTKVAAVGGYRHASGYVYDEFLPKLRGTRGRAKYREMVDTDPVIGGMIYGISSIIRAADWNAQPSEADIDGQYAKWLEDTIYNMNGMKWDDVIEDALSMIVFGFAVQEVVIGKNKDGSIGLNKLFPIAQESIIKWDLDNVGNVLGVWQSPLNGGFDIYIPASKLIHYKTKFAYGNPEGRSLLRNCYRSYHMINTVMIAESIGAERDLTGLPVLYAPDEFLAEPTNRAALERIVRDIKFNDQGGCVMPSDPFEGKDGSLSGVRKFELKLLTAEGGAGKVDTRKIIQGHQIDMARSLLADFLMLGSDGKGSYSLSVNKTQLFVRAVEALLENIGQTLDRTLTPLLWKLNGFPPEMMPCFRAGRIAPVDLQELGDFISKIAGAGILLNDEATEDYIRDAAGFPPAERSENGESIKEPSEEDDMEEGEE